MNRQNSNDFLNRDVQTLHHMQIDRWHRWSACHLDYSWWFHCEGCWVSGILWLWMYWCSIIIILTVQIMYIGCVLWSVPVPAGALYMWGTFTQYSLHSNACMQLLANRSIKNTKLENALSKTPSVTTLMHVSLHGQLIGQVFHLITLSFIMSPKWTL